MTRRAEGRGDDYNEEDGEMTSMTIRMEDDEKEGGGWSREEMISMRRK